MQQLRMNRLFTLFQAFSHYRPFFYRGSVMCVEAKFKKPRNVSEMVRITEKGPYEIFLR